MSRSDLNINYSNLGFANKNRLRKFIKEFTQTYFDEYTIGHLVMAAYASIPTFIYPDLLYKFHANFGMYQWGGKKYKIHLVAISDVIQSSFLKDVGYNLFVMDPEIKKVLSEWLSNELKAGNEKKLYSFETIAQFVKSDLKYQSADIEFWGGDAFVQAQEFGANKIVDTNTAFKKIVRQIQLADAPMEQLVASNKLKEILAQENITTDLSQFYLDTETEESIELLITETIQKKANARVPKTLVKGIFIAVDDQNLGSNIAEQVPTKFAPSGFNPLGNSFKARQLMKAIEGDEILNHKNYFEFKEFFNKTASDRKILQELDAWQDLEEDDVAVFYFSGKVEPNSLENNTGELMVLSLPELSINIQQIPDGKILLSQGLVEQKIYEIIKNKKIHIVMIYDFDYSDYNTEPRIFNVNEKSLRNDSEMEGSAVVFYLGTHNNDIKRQGGLTGVLEKIFLQGGLSKTYKDLGFEIKNEINKSNKGTNNIALEPILAFPKNTEHFRFLNNKTSQFDHLELFFNEKRKGWYLNAGSNLGLNPSLGFMHTLIEVELPEGNQLIPLKRIGTKNSFFSDFNYEGSGKKFKAKLIQNSLNKVRFYLDKSLGRKERNELEDALRENQIQLIELSNNKFETHYIIAQNEEFGYFAYDPLLGESTPMVHLENNFSQFLIYLEYLAQWEGLIRYSNLNSKYNYAEISYSLQLTLDTEYEFYNPEYFNITIQNYYDEEFIITIEVRSKNRNGEYVSETITHRQKGFTLPELDVILHTSYQDLHLTPFLLDNNMAIQMLQAVPSENQPVPENDFSYDLYPYSFDLFNQRMGDNNSFYLKLFLTDKAVNFKPFEQEGVQEGVISKGLDFYRGEEFNFQNANWISFTLPIQIKYELMDELPDDGIDSIPIENNPNFTSSDVSKGVDVNFEKLETQEEFENKLSEIYGSLEHFELKNASSHMRTLLLSLNYSDENEIWKTYNNLDREISIIDNLQEEGRMNTKEYMKAFFDFEKEIKNLLDEVKKEDVLDLENETKATYFAEIRKLLAENKMKELFNELEKIAKSNSSYGNQLILLQSRYNSLQKSILNYTISTEQSNISMNQIRAAILSLINDLENDKDIQF